IQRVLALESAEAILLRRGLAAPGGDAMNPSAVYGVAPAVTRESVEEHLFGRAMKIETQTTLASARWSEPDNLRAAALNPDRPFYFGNEQRDPGAVFLGVLPSTTSTDLSAATPVGWRDNRHLVTVAG